MTDPLTENQYELFERAESEQEARNLTTAAALSAMAAEAFQSRAMPRWPPSPCRAGPRRCSWPETTPPPQPPTGRRTILDLTSGLVESEE